MRPRPAAVPAAPLLGDAGHGVAEQGRAVSGPSGSVGADLSDGPGRPATPVEADLIAAAVLDSPLVSAVVAEDLRISGIRTSTGAPDWAFAVLRPLGAPDPAIAVLRWDTCCGWVLDQVGTARFGRHGCETAARSGEAAHSA
ncbi:hypothetical protein [Frankia sp. AgKG'84/4]|uniref:hypothetical protein n=1 Tax=Frankia sp. AgKG'84/4 TaxID=573490 RepID=UPI00200FEE31|nr:hypothetical protein [Frankia sp. AgKG'84/4]MCL9797283.1 hypothetical protein [Frankia sp. AgKG'84/4]